MPVAGLSGPVAWPTVPTVACPHPNRRWFPAVLLVVASIALAACGAKEPSKADLRDALVDSGLSRQVSTCVADAVLDTLSPAEVEQLVERGPGGAPVDDPDRTDDSADKLRKAMDRCRTLQDQASASSTTTTSLPAGAGAGSGTAVGDTASSTTLPSTTVPSTAGPQFNTTQP